METVKVRRTELLQIVERNRREHAETFDEAMETFRGKLKTRLTKMLEKAGTDEPEVSVGLSVPTHHLGDYDTVVAMLKLSIDEVIELTESQFREYVMDDWRWAREWTRTNSTLSAKARTKASIYTMGAPDPVSWTRGNDGVLVFPED